MLTFFRRSLGIAIPVLCFSLHVHAGTFTPEEGTTITSSTVTVEWETDAPFQWVRAFDGGGARIYDSGLNRRSNGSVSFYMATSDTSLQVIFYESGPDGNWTTQVRDYAVQIGRVAADGSADTLSGLSCPPSSVAKFLGGTWRCANDEALGVREVYRSVAAVLCGDGEELTRDATGAIRCASERPGCLANYSELPASAQSIWDGVTGNQQSWAIVEDSESVCQVTSPSATERYTFTSQGVMYFQTTGENGNYETVHEAFPDVRSLVLIRNCLPVLPCENTGAFP